VCGRMKNRTVTLRWIAIDVLFCSLVGQNAWRMRVACVLANMCF
jgi:hypothetical protein